MGARLLFWAKRVQDNSSCDIRHLCHRLHALMASDSPDVAFDDLVQTRLHLNLEIDKEWYWEQQARAN